MGDARWEGAEWVGDEGRELGKAEWVWAAKQALGNAALGALFA